MNIGQSHKAVLPELTVDIPLKMKLFPYQANGVAYNLEKKKTIIGDEPGLGKSGQAIASVIGSGLLDKGPCLIICPSSLKINWQREFEKWSNERCIILSEKVKNTWHHYYQAGLARVFIVNYESLKKYFVYQIPKGKHFKSKDVVFKDQIRLFSSVVIDESHRVKETTTLVSKLTLGICWGKDMVLALTGTPVVNTPADLIAQLAIIGQIQCFGGISAFKQTFCLGPKKRSNLDLLNKILTENCFYRREKKEVLKDLPDKIRTKVYCELPESFRVEYGKAQIDLEKYLKEYKKLDDAQARRSMGGAIMVQMGILKNISARGKIQDVKDYVDEIVNAGEKIILFVHQREVGDQLKAIYPKAVMIRGGMSGEERQHSVDQFQNNPNIKVIICSIKAAGVGLTLTASSRVAFIELPWTAADSDQCEDRAHRIGQKDSVQAIYFLGRNTIDNYIYQIIQDKRETASQVTGDENTIEETVFNSLIDLLSLNMN